MTNVGGLASTGAAHRLLAQAMRSTWYWTVSTIDDDELYTSVWKSNSSVRKDTAPGESVHGGRIEARCSGIGIPEWR